MDINWNYIFEALLLPILGILVKFIVDYLTAKKNELNANTSSSIANKYETMIINTVLACVTATNQTYVEGLKKAGKFDAEAQKMAFDKTLEAILLSLSEDAKKYISEMTGDINVYLTQLIESTVNQAKKN